MGTRRSYAPGPTSRRVRTNLSELREQRRISLRSLSLRLERLGHPLLASGLSKIETGARRADVDDLMALAVALDVSPNRLFLTGTAGDEKIELTPETVASERTAWRWGTGEAALPVDLWTDKPVSIDLDRSKRFRQENRPHDPSLETTLQDLEKHKEALAGAVRACREAVEKSGLPQEDVLSYVGLTLRMGELFSRASEGDQSDEHR